MSKRLDEALAALGVGLQTPRPDDTYGEISPRVSDRCARCDRADTACESEFCAPCRSFLLGDGRDPMLPAPLSIELRGSADGFSAAIYNAWRRMASAWLDSMTPVMDWWSEHGPMIHDAAMANPDQSMTFGMAVFALEHESGWLRLACEIRGQLAIEAWAFPSVTVHAEPTDDPLRVLVHVAWSSLDPVFTRSYDYEQTPIDIGIVRDLPHSIATNDLTIFAEPRLPVCRIIPPRER